MKITVFTSNQPRHLSLIESLSTIAEEVFAVQEVTTVVTGKKKGLYRHSEVMEEYFSHVIAAEKKIFGLPRFVAPAKPGHRIHQLLLGMDDLNLIDPALVEPALHSDVYVVFGASYIKGDLCNFLIKHRAYNIHMGTSPYYRGASCNFWAVYDGHPDYVGATIHLLSKGLDSGDILFHALPKADAIDPFTLGMKAVQYAHEVLVAKISSGELASINPVRQDKSQQIRYTVNADFTDEIARTYLEQLPAAREINEKLKQRDSSKFIW